MDKRRARRLSRDLALCAPSVRRYGSPHRNRVAAETAPRRHRRRITWADRESGFPASSQRFALWPQWGRPHNRPPSVRARQRLRPRPAPLMMCRGPACTLRHASGQSSLPVSRWARRPRSLWTATGTCSPSIVPAGDLNQAQPRSLPNPPSLKSIPTLESSSTPGEPTCFWCPTG